MLTVTQFIKHNHVLRYKWQGNVKTVKNQYFRGNNFKTGGQVQITLKFSKL